MTGDRAWSGSPPPADRSLDDDLAGLAERSYAALQAEWQRLFRSRPPRAVSRDLLALGVAWALQCRVRGGLTPSARRQLAALAETVGPGADRQRPRTATLRIGSRLLREWNGVTHEVLVDGDGFVWRGTRWASLSAIAREITGARWSGPRFFGLRARRTAPTPSVPARTFDADG